MGLTNAFVDRTTNSFISRTTNTWDDSYFSGAILNNYLNQQYHLLSYVQNELVQVDAILTQIELLQTYSFPVNIQQELSLLYALRLGTTFIQLYGDASDPKGVLGQLYHDAGWMQNELKQLYRDALRSTSSIKQKWNINYDVVNFISQVWGISENEVMALLGQVYDLRDFNTAQGSLSQVWLLEGEQVNLNTDSFNIVLNDTLQLDSPSISIEGSLSDYKLTCDLILSQAHYYACSALDKITVTINAEQFIFYIYELKRNFPKRGGTVYYCRAHSRAFMLDTPYSRTLNEEFASGMASNIVTDLAATQGVSVEWNVIDWVITENKLYADDDSPLDVIRKVKDVIGAVLQSSPDGTLRVEYKYKQALSATDFTPDLFLQANENYFNVSESPTKKPGYNRYMISDQLSSSESINIEELEADQTATSRHLAGYVVPWTGAPATLTTSSDYVSSIQYESIVTEDVTEDVEFVNGAASVGKSMYALVSVDWKDAVLGSITFGEDGNLVAEIVDGPTEGCSVAEIVYTTRYYKWFVVSSNFDDDIQFILKVEDQ